MKIGKRFKWIYLFVIMATIISLLLMPTGIASAAAPQPSINPPGGTYNLAQTVVISNITYGDTVYYTTDGSNPESSSTRIVYSGPFTVYQQATVQAISYDPVTGWSSVASAYFNINGTSALQTPIISPDGGTFTTAQGVTINNIPSGDTAYYTTDGSNPETSNTHIAYTRPFTVSQSETIEAVNSGLAGWSYVTSAYFSINGYSMLEAPVISPDGGIFSTAQGVAIGNIPGGATTFYTTDGSNPETSSTRIAYTEPFTVYQSETIEAVNSSPAGWSNVTSAYFNINGTSALQTPIISPNGGTFTTAQNVTINNIPSGDTAYYTTDGSNPETSSTRIAYTEPFTVYQSETIEAVNSSPAGWSSVASAYFNISGSSTLEAPIIYPDGGTFTTAQGVAIGNIPGGDTACYTTDGSNPETSSTRITYTEPFTVYQSETVNAAIQDQYGNWSIVTSVVFSIENLPQPPYNYQPNRRIRVFFRGREIVFDVLPIIINGRTLVPIRQIAAALGLSDNDLQWDPSGTVTIINGSDRMIIRNNQQQVYFDGKAYATDVPAQIVNGRMMVPLRQISQLFNRSIQWDSSSGAITIQ